MPLQKLQFKPGVNRDQTNYTNEGGWFECDKIRFRSGYPQKIGGWLRYGTFTIIGVCRQMFNWITTQSDNYLAMGTSKKVYLEAGTEVYDITPLQHTSTTPSASAPAVAVSVYIIANINVIFSCNGCPAFACVRAISVYPYIDGVGFCTSINCQNVIAKRLV